MRRHLHRALAVGTLLLLTATPAFADPNLPNIPPHRHYIVTPDGSKVEVGPKLCDDPSLQDAFNQFHVNVHRAVTGDTGPDQSAPGLHNGYGAELTAAGC